MTRAAAESRGPGLTLIFSHGVSLAEWERQGLLDREAGYYRELASHLERVTFMTYDTPGPALAEVEQRVRPIRVLHNNTRLPYRCYALLAPLAHWRSLRRSGVLKTNQLRGAWVGALAKWVTRRPLVVRSGYMWSRVVERRGDAGWLRRRAVVCLERLAVRGADLVVVATEDDRKYLADRHGLSPGRIVVLRNAMDTELFSPDDATPETEGSVLFVGRLSPEKNVPLLIEAMRQVPEAHLTLVGDGPERARLARAASGLPVDFAGVVPNASLPGLLRRAQVFVLPSAYEGSPKALLEAMACGKAVVGSNAPGIRDVIQDGANGLLVPPEPDALAAAIRRLLADAALRRRLGGAAREYVVARHSQGAIAAQEALLLRRLVGAGPPNAPPGTPSGTPSGTPPGTKERARRDG